MGDEGRLVLIAMGERGLVSRILPGRFRSAWTYAGGLSGVGQLTAASMLDLYRFRALGESTSLYGLVGCPIAHSVSPDMHNAAFGDARLDAVYLPLPAADVDDFVAFARAFRLQGASVTIPYKVALFERVDEVDAVARRIGAVNTIRLTDGRWVGANTDAVGFLQPLQDRHIRLQGIRAAVLGAGGAARAVAIALAPSGVEVTIHARDAAKAAPTATAVGASLGGWPPPRGSWDLLVNCTPIGMHPRIDETPLPAGDLTGRLVYDLIYNPMSTRLLREAASAGCQTIGGLDMLVAQAREQFQGWPGARPPAEVMRAAAERRLSEFNVHEDHVV
jgi:shikimate dehydrogenase